MLVCENPAFHYMSIKVQITMEMLPHNVIDTSRVYHRYVWYSLSCQVGIWRIAFSSQHLLVTITIACMRRHSGRERACESKRTKERHESQKVTQNGE
jgi:hypothetical protein